MNFFLELSRRPQIPVWSGPLFPFAFLWGTGDPWLAKALGLGWTVNLDPEAKGWNTQKDKPVPSSAEHSCVCGINEGNPLPGEERESRNPWW